MEIEAIRELALCMEGASESLPFGPDTLVFKVGGKMFMLIALDRQPLFINLKAEPEKSEFLREHYPQITPGWHMNKTHWNSVRCEGLKPSLIKELIEDSYRLVFNSLSKKLQTEISQSKE